MEVQLLCLGKVVVQTELADLVHLLRTDVREYRDNAQSAQRHEGYGLIVVAGIDIQTVSAERADQRYLGDIAACFLRRADIGMLAEFRVGLGLDVAARSGRNIVENNRQIDSIGDHVEMLDQTCLRGLVIIGRHGQQRVRAGSLRRLGKHDGGFGVVAAGAGNNGDPAVDFLSDKGKHIAVLLLGQRRRLAGGTAGDDRVGAVGDMKLKQLLQYLKIDCTV